MIRYYHGLIRKAIKGLDLGWLWRKNTLGDGCRVMEKIHSYALRYPIRIHVLLIPVSLALVLGVLPLRWGVVLAFLVYTQLLAIRILRFEVGWEFMIPVFFISSLIIALLPHFLYWAWRKGRGLEAAFLGTALVLDLGIVSAHGWYCGYTYKQVAANVYHTMSREEFFARCHAPLFYYPGEWKDGQALYGVYTDGSAELHVVFYDPDQVDVGLVGIMWND